ncbi:carbohydrate ABC transporter permease [Nonomuraea gerenzanensis]|uniref:Ribose ABC transport system, permease protein RbsC (TC 3.A.1.2.1) n=1 Tax=Nonomuraea gerenzanensis TaxID=93944 RepID=A0A1M4EIU5_9ACTN|nr:carbohydrate ABC transporter permease [Nonomuraea gerenzanensis]UBU10419.1 carbohydrate ABC transporter permease [Nonomuraea gerenzanensis]SBO98815.1 Ribose ABC transport system, permease protein RbsC (TC 3.A.1.2.1) [Nonomuraea gerenzanensis]
MRRLASAAKAVVLAAWLLITLFPLYWIVVTSLKPKPEIFSVPLRYWPANLTFEHYAELFAFADFGTYLLNSLLVSLVAAAAVTVIGVLGGYTLARFAFPGRGALMLAFLVTQMIPLFIALGPLYLLMSDLDLLNRLAGLMLVYVAMLVPFSTIIMRGFYERVPVALEEAAQVDGASRLAAMVRVVIPVMLPGIAATFIFAFVQCWNELFLAITFIDSEDAKTIPVAMNSFITQYDIDWGSMAAATVVSVVPTLVLFAAIRRYIVEGLTAGAVKG